MHNGACEFRGSGVILETYLNFLFRVVLLQRHYKSVLFFLFSQILISLF